MRVDGVFIAVEVDDARAADREVAQRLAEVCPVDIFRLAENGSSQALELVTENIDECVLCRLCIEAAPGAVKVIKLYDNEAVLA
jgi:NAD-dependent dihydropyrimidine dehydrogenase PreA subunit